MLLRAFAISIPIMAFVASAPSTFCVSLFILFDIFVFTLVWSVFRFFNTFGPELRKLITEDTNIPFLILRVSLLIGTDMLELSETTLFPVPDFVFNELVEPDCDCATTPAEKSEIETTAMRAKLLHNTIDLCIIYRSENVPYK